MEVGYQSQQNNKIAGTTQVACSIIRSSSSSHSRENPETCGLLQAFNNGGTTRVRDDIKMYEESLSPGYRFCPMDEELINFYLMPKIKGKRLPLSHIMEADVYQKSPDDLTAGCQLLFGKKEWYFFTPRERKYPKGQRPRRSAGTGYWKATGADHKVMGKDNNEDAIGYRKSLVYYRGKPPNGTKTDWIMNEYRPTIPPKSTDQTQSMRLDEVVLCRVYRKGNRPCKKQKGEGNESEQSPNHPRGGSDDTSNSRGKESMQYYDINSQNPVCVDTETPGIGLSYGGYYPNAPSINYEDYAVAPSHGHFDHGVNYDGGIGGSSSAIMPGGYAWNIKTYQQLIKQYATVCPESENNAPIPSFPATGNLSALRAHGLPLSRMVEDVTECSFDKQLRKQGGLDDVVGFKAN